MQSYSEPLITCDKVMQLFTPNFSGGLQHGGVMQSLQISHGTDEAGYLSSALERLKKDGHLLTYGLDNAYLKVGADFFQFKEQGGYKEWVNRENYKESVLNAINESGINANKNSVETGNSVQKLNNLLRPATKAQIFIATVTLFIAALAAWISFLNYKTTKNSNSLELRLKSSEEAIRNLEQHKQKIPPQEVKDTAHLTEKSKK